MCIFRGRQSVSVKFHVTLAAREAEKHRGTWQPSASHRRKRKDGFGIWRGTKQSLSILEDAWYKIN